MRDYIRGRQRTSIWTEGDFSVIVASMQDLDTITFRVYHPNLPIDSYIYVVGSSPELGLWKPAKGMALVAQVHGWFQAVFPIQSGFCASLLCY